MCPRQRDDSFGILFITFYLTHEKYNIVTNSSEKKKNLSLQLRLRISRIVRERQLNRPIIGLGLNEVSQPDM